MLPLLKILKCQTIYKISCDGALTPGVIPCPLRLFGWGRSDAYEKNAESRTKRSNSKGRFPRDKLNFNSRKGGVVSVAYKTSNRWCKVLTLLEARL